FANDNLWRGPVSMDVSSTITVQPGSRLNIFGGIDDALNASPSGSDLTLTGGGELLLAGAGSYRGVTYVKQGVLTVANGQALGGTGIAEEQTLTTTATTGTFTLSFTNFQGTTDTTGALNLASATLATDVQTALNGLASIGGVGGTATVSQTGT